MCKEVQDGQNCSLCDTEVTYLVVLKTEDRDYVKSDVRTSVINADEINLLCGKEKNKGWKSKVDLEDDKLEFKGHDKIVELTESDGGIYCTRRGRCCE